MKTPIADFVKAYRERSPIRLHMPGHKGAGPWDREALDITEVKGADSLYEAEGIIARSEENAARLFGTARTFYSAEGSSLAIRAMLALFAMHERARGRAPVILAGRNCHRVFLSAAALLGIGVRFLPAGDSYLSPSVDERDVEARLSPDVGAVYLTSPDYLGGITDLSPIARLCHARGALLLVDNAHGAYLKFLSPSLHPMDRGADLSSDSAHKTLPVLTGGAYLHVSKTAPALFAEEGRRALALFGSTSPSYLILSSLDECNARLAEGYPDAIRKTAGKVSALKKALAEMGFELWGDEPLKCTIRPKSYGYTGAEVAEFLREKGIEVEFSDPDHVVLMFSPMNGDEAFSRLMEALSSLAEREKILLLPPRPVAGEAAFPPAQALLMAGERVSVEESLGRVLADFSVGCPPAVPIVTVGERIGEDAVSAFRYYGIDSVTVVKE